MVGSNKKKLSMFLYICLIVLIKKLRSGEVDKLFYVCASIMHKICRVNFEQVTYHVFRDNLFLLLIFIYHYKNLKFCLKSARCFCEPYIIVKVLRTELLFSLTKQIKIKE